MHLRTVNSVISLAKLGLLSMVVVLPLVGTGCDTKGEASSSNASAPATQSATSTPVAVIQQEQELSFSQVVPKWKAVADGQVVYYRFSYADRDGVMHYCELPEAMAEGKSDLIGWQCTFQAYEVHRRDTPRPVATQAEQVDVSDFPFVAPPPGNAGTARAAAQSNQIAMAGQAQSATDANAKMQFEQQVLPQYVRNLELQVGHSVKVISVQYEGNSSTFQVARDAPVEVNLNSHDARAGLIASVRFSDGTITVFSFGGGMGWHEMAPNMEEGVYSLHG